MSNSIWHKANEKPELNKYVIVRKHGFAQWKVFKFDNKTTFFEPFTGDLWAYMADVIAQADKVELQADKAERLQKAVDELWLDIDRHFAHQRGTKTPEYVSTQKLGELRAKLWEIANDTKK